MWTETPVLNEEICCRIYAINLSERHHLMAMRVQSGTPVLCMAIALPDRREFAPKSSSGKSKYIHIHWFALHPDDRDDV